MRILERVMSEYVRDLQEQISGLAHDFSAEPSKVLERIVDVLQHVTHGDQIEAIDLLHRLVQGRVNLVPSLHRVRTKDRIKLHPYASNVSQPSLDGSE